MALRADRRAAGYRSETSPRSAHTPTRVERQQILVFRSRTIQSVLGAAAASYNSCDSANVVCSSSAPAAMRTGAPRPGDGSDGFQIRRRDVQARLQLRDQKQNENRCQRAEAQPHSIFYGAGDARVDPLQHHAIEPRRLRSQQHRRAAERTADDADAPPGRRLPDPGKGGDDIGGLARSQGDLRPRRLSMTLQIDEQCRETMLNEQPCPRHHRGAVGPDRMQEQNDGLSPDLDRPMTRQSRGRRREWSRSVPESRRASRPHGSSIERPSCPRSTRTRTTHDAAQHQHDHRRSP